MANTDEQAIQNFAGIVGLVFLSIAAFLSLLDSVLSLGIYLWGSPLWPPDGIGVLLCLGTTLSFPIFVTLLNSRSFHRRATWLLASMSLGGVVAAMWLNSPNPTSFSKAITDALHFIPLEILIAITLLVEFSYALDLRAGHHRWGKSNILLAGNEKIIP